MTMDRFRFQTEQADKYTGTILNVGCNTDPASLGARDNVINCDAYTNNLHIPYPVDSVFDCCEDTWPFEDNTCDLVIFGDILEHLFPDECLRALKEARRVSRNVCATLPRDHRILEIPNYYEQLEKDGVVKGGCHMHVYEQDEIKNIFKDAGWKVVDFQVVDYGFVPTGYYIEATR